jgi:hypothetical protein
MTEGRGRKEEEGKEEEGRRKKKEGGGTSLEHRTPQSPSRTVPTERKEGRTEVWKGEMPLRKECKAGRPAGRQAGRAQERTAGRRNERKEGWKEVCERRKEGRRGMKRTVPVPMIHPCKINTSKRGEGRVYEWS